MINVNELDFTNKGADTAYAEFRYDFIQKTEGIRRAVYLDNADEKFPTIGIGFNLTDDGILHKVLAAFDADTQEIFGDIRDIIPSIKFEVRQ